MTVLSPFASGKNLISLEVILLASRSRQSSFFAFTHYRYICSRSCSAAFTCTSSGMLRRTSLEVGHMAAKLDSVHSDYASLPSRLCDLKFSENWETLAYGGDEVDLSVWNTELTFKSHPTESSQSSGSTKKRKRNDDLFPAEIWRARNVKKPFILSNLS